MKKLPNAPLQEVIFEVKWDLSFDSASRELVDPGYNLARRIVKFIIGQEQHGIWRTKLSK